MTLLCAEYHCSRPADDYLHMKPAESCPGCKAPDDHHTFVAPAPEVTLTPGQVGIALDALYYVIEDLQDRIRYESKNALGAEEGELRSAKVRYDRLAKKLAASL